MQVLPSSSSFTNALMKVSSTAWTLTPSHFPALRHHSVPLTRFFSFFNFALSSWNVQVFFFWSFCGTAERPGRPPCPLCFPQTLTLAFFSKCWFGEGGGTRESPTLWWFVSVWMHGNVSWALSWGDPYVFNDVITCFSSLSPRKECVGSYGFRTIKIWFCERQWIWFFCFYFWHCFVCMHLLAHLKISWTYFGMIVSCEMLVKRQFGHLAVFDVHTVIHCKGIVDCKMIQKRPADLSSMSLVLQK